MPVLAPCVSHLLPHLACSRIVLSCLLASFPSSCLLAGVATMRWEMSHAAIPCLPWQRTVGHAIRHAHPVQRFSQRLLVDYLDFADPNAVCHHACMHIEPRSAHSPPLQPADEDEADEDEPSSYLAVANEAADLLAEPMERRTSEIRGDVRVAGRCLSQQLSVSQCLSVGRGGCCIAQHESGKALTCLK